MFELLFLWILAAAGVATLAFLSFCLVRNMFRGFVKAAFIEEDPKDALPV
ncbi:hypothetical protein V5T82_03255 [Magnetovibrio sp. PR-2]